MQKCDQGPIHYTNPHFGHLKPSWWRLKTVARAVLCLLAVCRHGVHSAAHECGLTRLQRTEKGAGDSAPDRVCCAHPSQLCRAEASTCAHPRVWLPWVVSSKASYPQWICFLRRKQIERGEFKDKPSPIEPRERGRSRGSQLQLASEMVAADVAEQPSPSVWSGGCLMQWKDSIATNKSFVFEWGEEGRWQIDF